MACEHYFVAPTDNPCVLCKYREVKEYLKEEAWKKPTEIKIETSLE
jgi:hypothetical protein